MVRRGRFLGLCAAAVLACHMAPAMAAESYAGARISVVVGYSPGGGYDDYARLLSEYLGRQIPGQPAIIVQNMPGAASLKSVQYISRTAPQDGTVMAIFNPGLIGQSLAGPDKIDIDFAKLRFVGSMTSDARACYLWHSKNIRSFEDLLKSNEVVMGATSVGSNSYSDGALLRNLFGAKIRHVTGYPGSSEQRLAIERGELDGGCGSWSSVPKSWMTEGKAIPLVRFSKAAVSDMPANMPYVMDLARTTEQRQILSTVLSPAEISRPFAMGPKVPEERLKILRTAFNAMLADPTFLATAERTQREIIGPLTGEEVEAMIKGIYAAPREVIAKAADAVK